MNILAVETATEACSAALYVKGVVLERYELAPREHNYLILPMVDSLLAEAGLTLKQLDALAFGRGPGSFTGVRIATAVIQGLAFAADLPVAPVSTLAALALQAFDESAAEQAWACIDARMSEVYWGVYRRGAEAVEPLVPELVCPPDSIPLPPPGRGVGIGSGWGTYEESLCGRLGPERVVGIMTGRFPRAGHIARLGAHLFCSGSCVSAEAAQPIYLRDQVAKKAGAKT